MGRGQAATSSQQLPPSRTKAPVHDGHGLCATHRIRQVPKPAGLCSSGCQLQCLWAPGGGSSHHTPRTEPLLLIVERHTLPGLDSKCCCPIHRFSRQENLGRALRPAPPAAKAPPGATAVQPLPGFPASSADARPSTSPEDPAPDMNHRRARQGNPIKDI